jgi:hypothetical protein
VNLISSVRKFHNSKLFFSKTELSKILSCYAIGVSKGNWKDYAMAFSRQEATFYMFKHSMTSPDCILTKTTNFHRKNIFYNLELQNKKKTKFTKMDDLIVLLKRHEFYII